ncbi:MAG: hypothetical protein Q8862_06760 [Bacteroidota bacterium]|nr:hypothetical protein [Bacteroidota bacterium]MDP4204908.1 hypothetical protein [Bacteroidota bacterium]
MKIGDIFDGIGGFEDEDFGGMNKFYGSSEYSMKKSYEDEEDDGEDEDFGEEDFDEEDLDENYDFDEEDDDEDADEDEDFEFDEDMREFEDLHIEESEDVFGDNDLDSQDFGGGYYRGDDDF